MKDLVRMWRYAVILSALIVLVCCLTAGCSERISRVVIRKGTHGSAAIRAAETARVGQILATVAISHGLTAKPSTAWPAGTSEYAKRLPLSPGGFGGPSILLSLDNPRDFAVITVNGTGSPHPSSDRLQIAAELKGKLAAQFGADRVMSLEENWTDF